MNKNKLEQINYSVWSGHFKDVLIKGNIGNFDNEQIEWIVGAVKQRLNRSFRDEVYCKTHQEGGSREYPYSCEDIL